MASQLVVAALGDALVPVLVDDELAVRAVVGGRLADVREGMIAVGVDVPDEHAVGGDRLDAKGLLQRIAATAPSRAPLPASSTSTR